MPPIFSLEGRNVMPLPLEQRTARRPEERVICSGTSRERYYTTSGRTVTYCIKKEHGGMWLSTTFWWSVAI